jgi:hypothetical protein
MEQAMDDTLAEQGYIIIRRKNNESPPEELFTELTHHIGEEKFEEMREVIADQGVLRLGGDAFKKSVKDWNAFEKTVKDLLHYGVDVSSNHHSCSSSKLTCLVFHPRSRPSTRSRLLL